LMVSGVVLHFLGIEKGKSCREPFSQFCKIADANNCHGVCKMYELFWVINCCGICVQMYELFSDLKIAIPPFWESLWRVRKHTHAHSTYGKC
jgi:hypothetical protein